MGKHLLLAIFYFLSFHLAFSQTHPLKIYNQTSADGLLSDNVECVYQDSRGFLWIGSSEGLLRWDGHTYQQYLHVEGDTLSISNNIVYTIYEDSHHQLWIGTINGLNRYDPVLDRVHKVAIAHLNPNVPVNAIKEDSKQQLWLGTSDGLCRYNFSKRSADWYYDQPENGLCDGVIFALDIDQDDQLWLGTYNGGLIRFNPDTRQAQCFKYQANDPNSLCSNRIREVLVDNKGTIWAGSIDHGLTQLSRDGKVLRQVNRISATTPLSKTNPRISCLYQDKSNTLWVGAMDEPVYYLDEARNQFVPLLNPVEDKYHIHSHSINTMHEDHFGNLWLGSERLGIFYSNTYKNTFRHYFHDYSSGTGLSHPIVTSFCKDSQERLWIGTYGGGLDYLDLPSDRLYPSSVKLSSKTIEEIKADTEGNLWIATMGGGVTRFNPRSGSSITFLHQTGNENSLILNDVKSLIVTDSLVWMGTFGQGLCLYDLKKQQFYHHKNNQRFGFDLFKPTWINHLFKDSKNRLWIGAYGGLALIEGNRQRVFRHSGDPGSLSDHDILMIAEDQNQNIWIVSVSGGLEKYNEANHTFIHYSQRYHLPLNLKAIQTDTDGKLWLSSNSGLICFDPKTNTSSHYSRADGLQSDFFSAKAIFRSKKNQLFIGGNNGFNSFYPKELQEVNTPKEFYYMDLSIFGQIQHPGKQNSGLSKSLILTDTLRLQYNQSFFTISFSEINFYAPQKTEYAYKLEGLHEQWINNKAERRVSFTHLPPGSYRLKVKYTLPDGQWYESPKTLTLIIDPPWWSTWWFRTLLMVLIPCMLYMAYILRIRSIKKRNQDLAEEVKLRTTELSERNSDLEASNEEIKLQKEKLEEFNEETLRQTDKILKQQEQILLQNQALEKTVEKLSESDATKNLFFNILAHDLKGPISAIKSLSELLLNNLKTLSAEEIAEFSTHIKNSSESTQNLLHNLLEWARTQGNYLDYRPQPVNLLDSLIQTLHLTEQQYLQKSLHIKLIIAAEHTVLVDHNMLSTILRNLISNAIKFTPDNGTIIVSSLADQEHIELQIQDTGVGMDAEKVNQLFQLNKRQSTPGTRGERGTGLGLAIVKEFVEMNHGTLSVESSEGKGTLFKIKLPKSDLTIASVKDLNQPVLSEPADHSPLPQINDETYIQIKGTRILIVEDHEGVRNQLRHELASLFEILEAEHGQAGLELASESQPTVIVTDMVMPVMDGLEFCKALKQNPQTSHIPVIVLTSHDDEQSKLSSYYAGADIHLTKPARKEMLIQIVFNILQGREMLRQKIQHPEQHSYTNDLNELDKEFLQQISSYIETHITQPDLEVQHIVRHIGMSRSVLYAKFKALTGQGVNEFIRMIKLRKSTELLGNPRLSVNEIADAVGFNSSSYFIRCFSKIYGCTPTEFREKKSAP